jgi:hypothetical protein
VPVLVAHAHQQRVARETGVVDEDVEVACLLDDALRGLGVGDVGLERAAADLVRDRLGLVAAGAVAEDDARARLRQLARDRRADASRTARDERGLAFERAEVPLAQLRLPDGEVGARQRGAP